MLLRVDNLSISFCFYLAAGEMMTAFVYVCVRARVSASVISYIYSVVAVTAVVCFVSEWNSKWPYYDYNKIRKLNLNALNRMPPWKLNYYCRMCALIARWLCFHFHSFRKYGRAERCFEMRNELISTPGSNFHLGHVPSQTKWKRNFQLAIRTQAKHYLLFLSVNLFHVTIKF